MMSHHELTQAAAGEPPAERFYTVRVAPRALATLVRLAARSVPGVLAVGGRAGRLGRRAGSDGVRAEVRGGAVWVEVGLIVERTASMRDVSSAVQRLVAEAIETMLALPVAEVNVYVEDVR
jgi:uncharacterized alkaline shock family protein YloU